MTVSIRDGAFADVVKRVLDGEVDFGLTGVETRNPDLDYLPLYRDRFGVVCSRDHPLASPKGVLKWSQLRKHQSTMVGLAGDTQIRQSYRNSMRSHGLSDPSEEVSSSGSLFSLMSKGARFAIVPALTANTHQLETLRFVPLSDPVLHRENFLVTRRLRALSPSAVNLVESMREVLRSRPLPAHVELTSIAA